MSNEPAAPGDIVMAILALSNPQKSESWPILRMYEAIKTLKEKDPTLNKALHFSCKGGQFYSKALEEIFFNLGTTQLVEVRNPEYNFVLVRPESKKRMRQYLRSSLPTSEYKRLGDLAKDFRDLLIQSMTRNEADACSI